MKNFNGYALFDHIRHPKIRTYNRVNVYMNVRDRHGIEVGRNYLNQFKRREQFEIFEMLKEINQIGYEQYRRDIMRERNVA